MARLADPTYDPVGLGPIRIALMSDPSRVTHTTSDLTARNPMVWKKWEAYRYRDNEAQYKVVTSIKEVKNKLTACVGPPGTGKTTVLTDITTGAVLCGHTTLVCAVSNNAVDKAANSCWANFPAKERNSYKFLRYETASAEMRAYLTRKDINNPAGQDQNARPTYKDAATPEDDEVILQTMAEAAAKYSEHDRELRDLVEKLGDYNKALSQKAEIDSRKKSNVPSAMTLPNRIHDLTTADLYNANGDYDAEIEAYKSDKLDAAELKRIRESREYRTEAQLVALGEDKLDQAEIDARVRDGRIPSVQQRDESAKYRDSVKKYIRMNGDVSRQDRLTFETLRMPIVIREMRETHVMFTTCNNAGSEMVQIGFSPSFINIDEAGQLTLAAFANVLTSFNSWEAVNIFGDPKQLLPFFLSGRANEFRANAESSVLSKLEEKEYPILRLVLQYRMAPAISEWPSKFFYDGLLKNHPAVLADNKFRRVAREISKEHYGIRGPSGNGSEYWMIDVVNGVSRVQSNGTSLQNYANANRIALLVDQTLAKGVDPSMITVLVYYTGQLNLVAHKVEATTHANGRQWAFSEGSQVSTVDSFQGEENDFVFIDIVVAHQGGPAGTHWS